MYNAGIIEQVDEFRHKWTGYEAAGGHIISFVYGHDTIMLLVFLCAFVIADHYSP